MVEALENIKNYLLITEDFNINQKGKTQIHPNPITTDKIIYLFVKLKSVVQQPKTITL